MKIYSIPAIAALAAVTLVSGQFTATAQSSQQNSASQSEANGLNTVTFEIAAGKVMVSLPADLRAGDTISGTVTAEAKMSGTLEGMVIEINGKQTVVSGKVVRFMVPTAGERAPFLLKDGNGVVLAKTKLRFAAPVARTGQGPPQGSDFSLPQLGQTGRPVEINGPFDGNASNTTCSIASQPVQIIAESPRQAFFISPTTVTGPAPMTVADKGKESTGTFRNIGVSLNAPKTNLVRGEKTTLSVQVSGLQGIQSNVPLKLVTSGSANMSGGNTQSIEIRPTDVGSAGSFTRNFDLTGVKTGGFTITGTVLIGQPVAAGSCKCVCELGKTPIVTAGKSKLDGGGMQHGFKANVAKAACNGSKCSIEKTEYAWSIGAGSTATYTIAGAKKDGETLKLDVTGAGTVVLTVTVTITCSDGTKCSATGTLTFTVDAK